MNDTELKLKAPAGCMSLEEDMQVYAYDISFAANQSFSFCVEPGKTFCVQLFGLGVGEALTPLSGVPNVVSLERVMRSKLSNGNYVYFSQGSDTSTNWQTDWNWPTIQVKIPNTPPVLNAIIIIAVYEVDSTGNPQDAIGKRIVQGSPIYLCPPDSDSMALAIARPASPPSAKIAYIIPIATYHAYNLTGGGCFYGYQPTQDGTQFPKQTVVTMHRPGGGLGAFLGEPEDAYDTSSPRQQFEHWDAKFISWLYQQGYSIDFYTDLDLDDGTFQPSLYRLILSVGHHEYWIQNMRNNLNNYVVGGGNYACFSGNTCYRGITFGGPLESQITLVDDPLPADTVWQTVGLCFQQGGGRWGCAGDYFGQWTGEGRTSYGYEIRSDVASSWVFQGTSLTNGGCLGSQDYLVGYEADGVLPNKQNVTVLGTSPPLAGFNEGENNCASMVLVNDSNIGSCGSGSYKSGVKFNAGTSDWSRVLTSPDASSYADVVQITKNVIACLSASPPGAEGSSADAVDFPQAGEQVQPR